MPVAFRYQHLQTAPSHVLSLVGSAVIVTIIMVEAALVELETSITDVGIPLPHRTTTFRSYSGVRPVYVSFRISETIRVDPATINVFSPPQPYGSILDTVRCLIVIAEVVIVRPRLGIVVLPGNLNPYLNVPAHSFSSVAFAPNGSTLSHCHMIALSLGRVTARALPRWSACT
jgi:hypothetical protein